MNLGELIEKTLIDTQQQIRANLQSKNINASGKTSDSIKVRNQGGVIELYADGTGAPLQTTEIGRKPGKVPHNFTEILEEWANAKGIDIDPWAVLWTIKRKGTERHRGEHEDVYSTIIKKAREKIKKQIREQFAADVRTMIKTHF